MINAYVAHCAKKYFSEEQNIINIPDFDFQGKWINMINPTDKEIDFVALSTGVPEDFIKAALDEEERARIEIDEGTTLVLVDVPVIEEENDYYTYTTIPMGVIIKGDVFITVMLKSTSVIREFESGMTKGFSTAKKSRFLFQILYTNATKYLQYLRQIDKSSQRIQSELHKSMKNKELIQLLDLENSLVYFSTSLRSNAVVIDKLIKMPSITKYEEDMDLLEDVEIENRQALEMCNIHRDILSGTMDAFASVISNNLNIVMKLLTTITIVLTVPTIIASLFGMNVGGLPFHNNQYGFWIVTGISVILSIILGFVLFKKKIR